MTAALGLGLAALGRPAYINLGHQTDLLGARDPESLQARAWQVLDAAYALGLRHFDAARSYGRAEAFLAGWLRARDIGPAAVSVGSKWGYTYVADWRPDAEVHEVKDHALSNFEVQWPQTQALLGPWLRAYLIHSVTPDSPALEDAALHARLAELRDSGLRVGLSVSGPHQGEVIERALKIQAGGQPLFSAVQATWNPLEPSAGPALARARAAGWQVVVKEAVANGRLTARGEAGHHPVMQAVCARHGASPDAVALAAALAQPFVGVVLSGASTARQLEENVRARDLDLTPDDLTVLEELREPPEVYWQTRAGLPWT